MGYLDFAISETNKNKREGSGTTTYMFKKNKTTIFKKKITENWK